MKRLANRGDTIVEVLIAIIIASSGLAGAYITSNRSLQGLRKAQEHTEALKLAEGQLEQMRGVLGFINPYTNCPSPRPTRQSGDSDAISGNDCIKRIETFLAALMPNNPFPVDGTYGPETIGDSYPPYSGIKQFQALHPGTAAADGAGVTGAATWAALESNAFNRSTVFCMNGGVQPATNVTETNFGALPTASADAWARYTPSCIFTNGIDYHIAIDFSGDATASTFMVHVRWDSLGVVGHDEVTLAYRVD